MIYLRRLLAALHTFTLSALPVAGVLLAILLPFIGAGLIVAGAWLLNQPAGLIVAGLLILLDLNRKGRT